MKKLDFFERASINFQSAVSKITKIRSSSVISSHATKTIRVGKDLSSSWASEYKSYLNTDERRKDVDHSVKFVSETIQ